MGGSVGGWLEGRKVQLEGRRFMCQLLVSAGAPPPPPPPISVHYYTDCIQWNSVALQNLECCDGKFMVCAGHRLQYQTIELY